MFEYFPDNKNWSVAVAIAMAMGGQPTEIDTACRPLRALAAEAPDSSSREAWYDSWTEVASRLDELAARDESAGHTRSGARKRRRASVYHLMAERMMTNESPLKLESYKRMLDDFRLATKDEPIEFLEVPYVEGDLPALFIPAAGDDHHPAIVFFNGFDSTKEVVYLLGIRELAARGISVLLCDQPGSGGALRLRGLPTRHDMEVPAGACFEALAARPDVDDRRIAVGGMSMGGYFAPRAASVDHRFAACVAWGGFHDLAGVVGSQSEPAGVTPAFQTPWVFGAANLDEVRSMTPSFNLDPVIGNLTCPLLVIHGESDRRVPVSQARRTHSMATASRRRDLLLFESGSWGEDHCMMDNPTLAIDALADWLQEVLE